MKVVHKEAENPKGLFEASTYSNNKQFKMYSMYVYIWKEENIPKIFLSYFLLLFKTQIWM